MSTLEGWDRLKESGYFDAVDKQVYEVICSQPYPVDANQIFEKMSGVKYNVVQQAFTRLKKAGKIFKVGTHTGTSGFTRGVYSVRPPEYKERQETLF